MFKRELSVLSIAVLIVSMFLVCINFGISNTASAYGMDTPLANVDASFIGEIYHNGSGYSITMRGMLMGMVMMIF